MSNLSRMSLATPSQFWRKLGNQHNEELAAFGIEHFKRHQAFKYFQWRWNLDLLKNSEQLRFLVRHTRPDVWLRAALTPMHLSDEEWEGVDWPKHNRYLNTLFTRVIWEYASRHDRGSIMRLSEPTIGRPLPIRWKNRLISQDLANTALEVEAIVRALDGKAPATILEIGAGYGRTAFALLNLFPRARYVIVDVEPAISISKWYLPQLIDPERLLFLDPSQIDEVGDGAVDLALSISSLHEMTPEQLDGYLQFMDRIAAGGTTYIKQWTDWQNPEDHVRMRFADYPIPSRWKKLVYEACPIQTTFTQAAWAVPGGDG